LLRNLANARSSLAFSGRSYGVSRPSRPPLSVKRQSGEAERLAACDDAIALLREITGLERDDDGDVIFGADEDGHNDLLSRIAAFLANHDQ